MRNRPVISTAKVRGIIKKSGIGYVDATRRYHPTIANGISVWQLGSSVYFKVFGHNSSEYLETFINQLNEMNFTAVQSSDDTYRIEVAA